MRVLSLFSGIGGLDLGLQRAGMTIVGQVEIDPWCRRVLEKHWPEVPRHDDVRTCADWWGTRSAPDLVCGGFPCQPVSSAGRRLAQEDPRWLWPAFAEVIRRLRPRYALMENVPGLLVRGMGDVLGDLAACGYDAEWDCIPASALGAPHRRDRVWIVAYPQVVELRNGYRRRLAGQRRAANTPPPGDDGTAQPLADADDGQPHQSQGEVRPSDQRAIAWRRSLGTRGSSSAMADSDGPAGPSARTASQEIFRPGPIERPGRCASGGWGFWAIEPDVGRVAHGIPQRVDRLRGLGNAVVPQVAEHIGRMIMEAAP